MTSSVGNPVFMAAYLGLIAPLAVARLSYLLSRWRDDLATRPSFAAGIALHLVVLSMLSAAIVFTGAAVALGLLLVFFVATSRDALAGHPGGS